MRPTLKRQCFPLISLLPNPTSEHVNFMCSMCSINSFPLAFNPNKPVSWAWKLGPEAWPNLKCYFKIKNGSKLGFCGHGAYKSVNFIFGLGLGTWKKESLRLGLEWPFTW